MMLNKLTIVARIEAKKEKLDLVRIEVLKLLEPTRKEKGCIQYDLHQDNENPEIFIFVEIWENKKLWQIHMESNHLKKFVEVTGDSLNNLIINQMSQI